MVIPDIKGATCRGLTVTLDVFKYTKEGITAMRKA